MNRKIIQEFIMVVQVITVMVFLFSTVLFAHGATLPDRYDGTWSLTVSNFCDNSSHEIFISVKDNKVSSTQKALDIAGGIGHNGRVDIIVSHDGKTFYSVGNFTPTSGNGDWQSDNCSGKWKAVRK